MKKMKQSSNHFKQTRSLTQYSSGEDDSGAEDIFTKEDLRFSDFLRRSVDLKLKKTLSPPSSLKTNRSRTGMIDAPVHSATSARFEANTIRKSSQRLVSSTSLPNSRFKQSLSKTVIRHRSPVRARLWSGQNRDSDLSDERGTVADPGMRQGIHVSCKSSDSVTSSGGNTSDTVPVFPQQGTLKKLENRRRVLSDITKETVADFRFQIPSYYSRDVLPLDSDATSNSSDFSSMDESRNENNLLPKDNNGLDEPTANGVTRSRNSYPSTVDVSKEFKTTEEKGWFSLHYQKVSMILVIVVLLFFFGVGLIYLNVRFKDNHIKLSNERGNVYPVCGRPDHNHTPCIEKDQLSAVLSVLEILTPQLMTVAHDSLCNESGTSVSMSDTDVLNYLSRHTSYQAHDEAKVMLKSLKLLVLSNPHWDVAVIHEYPLDNLENEGHAKFDQNIDLLEHGQLVFKNPLLPLSCQVKLLVKALCIWISSLTAVLIAVTGIVIGLWDYKRRCEQHRQEVYMLVNKIIATVRNHYQIMQSPGGDGIPYISVEKCQNEIIGTRHSKYMLSAWEEAVNFIDVHESRILTDIQIIHGKPTKVWQWMCATPTSDLFTVKRDNAELRQAPEEDPDISPPVGSYVSPAHSSSIWNTKCRRNKVWQGRAFETIAGSPNSLPCSPTPCLKIRHMFDPDLEHGNEWPVLIEDSILEKCENVCILHLYVDCPSQEGCVFVKCSSPEEAGKAYRALHGWWFDTKLVTVKYLRTERYHERFPESASASSPLRPSNNQRLSLQELWHFPLEST